MAKIDIHIMEFGTKIEKLKDEVRTLVCAKEFDKDTIIKKVNDIGYLDDLYKRWIYCQNFSNIQVDGMFHEEGTKKINDVVIKFIKNITIEYDIEKAISEFYTDISKMMIYDEVTDSDVRDSIRWYLLPFIEIYKIDKEKLDYLF